MQLPLISHKASRFTESVIRGHVDRGAEVRRGQPGAGNARLPGAAGDQGAACRAIEADINQYAITWGAKNLRAGDRRARRAGTWGWRSIPRPRSPSPAAAPRRCWWRCCR